MTLKLRLKGAAAQPAAPFDWENLSRLSPEPNHDVSPLSPPTAWLPASDMKIFGAQPLSSTSDIGVVRCKDCNKPILQSVVTEHTVKCAQIRGGGKTKTKTKLMYSLDAKGSKKRKASPEPSDASQPPKKKAKPAPKVTKGRVKGPVDYDKQCGVINDKGLPCSRSLTCKSHSMGAKRAVQGRSRRYDDLLLDWQREHNPNFVEPVKRETKAEKKEKREKEKAEKKRQQEEAAAALGIDPNAKKSSGAAAAKKAAKKAAAAAAVARAEGGGDNNRENLDDLDSEAEVEEMVRSVRTARQMGLIARPLAVPCDAGSWFVQRRENARVCRDHLMNVFMNGGSLGANGGLGANRLSAIPTVGRN
ncbi:histone acetylation-related protein [Moniliophthora roreri MCA 2997]|uniref:Histone acetylation-related protein n=1 Tax=Moniliophthora roreri (strain MCA 2997) TaxID=1381753 RepID=V2XU93_MONRO|nr:histone acetylation-related protein [Moniliophthora roreri MCA 2997]